MNLFVECLTALTPEIIVIATALLVLLVDLTVVQEKSFAHRAQLTGAMTFLGCSLAMVWLALMPSSVHVAMLAISPVTQWLKMPLLLLTIFAVVLSWQARFTRHAGEYFALLLLGAAGLMLLVSSDNLLLIFIALELLSISLYALAAFDKGSAASSEAALKYLLFGGMSAAFTLFGISLVYGMAGDLQLGVIAARLRAQPVEPLFYTALVMTLVGFAFKLAAAPFHLWAPDVYEGAPTPVASFIASGSKVASFCAGADSSQAPPFLARAERFRWADYLPGWVPVLAFLAVFSMVVGNVAAIVQTNVKRLLAYSAIAHAGYALLALLADQRHALSALLFYTITYAFTVFGRIRRGGSGGGQRTAGHPGRLCRNEPARARNVVLHVGVYAFAGGHSAAVGILRQILRVHRRRRRPAATEPALAGGFGRRGQRRFTLLLPASAQADLRRGTRAFARLAAPGLLRAGGHRDSGRAGHRARLRAGFAFGQDHRTAQIPSFLKSGNLEAASVP